MTARLLTVAFAVLLLTGCLDRKEIFQKFIPKDEDTLARHFIDLIRTGDYNAAQQMLTPELRGDQAVHGLQQLHSLFDHGEPLEIETVGFDVSSTEQTRKTNLTYQLHFKDAWFIGSVLLYRNSEGTYVLGSHFYPATDSVKNINRFTLIGKSPSHLAALAVCILIPSFILYALFVCFRTPIRRKWLWIIFILFGLIQFHFNWTTGSLNVQPISILLFGVSAFSSGIYGPWILSWALPVGALIFLLRCRKLIKPPVREAPNQTESGPNL